MSVYEVECLCGEKVRTAGPEAKCGNCGRDIALESWQVRHTLTAQGVVINSGALPSTDPQSSASANSQIAITGERERPSTG